METTQIMIGGFLIQEPMTLLTDLILGFQCLALAYLLWQKGKQSTISRWIVVFLVLLGIGSIEGGIVNHGWFYLFGVTWKLPMVLIVGSSLPFLILANVCSLKQVVTPGTFRILRWLVGLEYLVFLGYLTTQPLETIDFKTMTPHLAIGLLIIVTLLQAYGVRKDPHSSRNLMLWGIAMLLPGGLVNLIQYSPDKWFNMFDLVHVLLMIPVYLFFHAGLAFARRESI